MGVVTSPQFRETPKGMTPADVDRRDILAFMADDTWYPTAEIMEEMLLPRHRVLKLMYGMRDRGWVKFRQRGAMDLEWRRG